MCNILICRCIQKHIQRNKDERTQFFRKIYLSLYLKGFERFTKGIICERWVGDWTELQHNDTPTLQATAVFLSRYPGLLDRGPGGPASAGTWFSFQHHHLQLIWTSCRRGYIIIWHPPTSCERYNSHSIQPFDSQGCPLISSTGCTCCLHRCISSFDSLAGVNMLQKEWYNKVSFEDIVGERKARRGKIM